MVYVSQLGSALVLARLALKDGIQHPDADRQMIEAFENEVACEPGRSFIGEELVAEGIYVIFANAQAEARHSSLWVETDQINDCIPRSVHRQLTWR